VTNDITRDTTEVRSSGWHSTISCWHSWEWCALIDLQFV
jgi:hypothetical protein